MIERVRLGAHFGVGSETGRQIEWLTFSASSNGMKPASGGAGGDQQYRILVLQTYWLSIAKKPKPAKKPTPRNASATCYRAPDLPAGIAPGSDNDQQS